jgi:hypothetical protein
MRFLVAGKGGWGKKMFRESPRGEEGATGLGTAQVAAY